MKHPFPASPDLTSVVMAYRNPRMIADEALPRYPVEKMNYRYSEYDLAEGFTVPDTLVGRKSAPTQVEFKAVGRDRSTKDHALDDVVPVVDVENDPNGRNRVARTSERLADLIALDREIRTANLIFDAAQYPAGHKETLAGTSVFGDPNSDPIGIVTDAMDALMMRPNVMVFGRSTFTRFARHPQVVKAVNGTSGDSGFARRQQVAELFEVEKVLVGEAFVNMNRPGQTANLQRAWGPHLALYYLAPLGGPDENPSFGFTAQYGKRIAGDKEDPNIGMRGGYRVRVGESVDEVIAAPMLGYFLENAGADPA
ncbi:hypothetical protein [Rhodospirillum centenum]|uniref:Uncharacterized protein n=1 Tax=Rhodospirillum centenum (strain ATCC 51521 / SW) TaxID=414684 RepID=B6IMZ7_RHOCS|nr:hypothetical protein [Rhodospirillum centenum]ACI98894.1 phage-related conserved hypothetical protein [Rhodospirillum centenum SW]